MWPDLPFWNLEGPAHDLLLVVRAGSRIDPDWEVMPVDAALAWLHRWLLDPRPRAVLADVHATLYGGLALSPWGDGDLHEPLRHALAEAIRFGDILILERRRLGTSTEPRPSEPPPSKPPSSKPKPGKTFVEIELLDPQGKRFPAKLVVTLPDGSKQQPVFDGFARIEGIDPGTCDVEFPDIDGREWGRSAPNPSSGGAGGSTIAAQAGECLSSLAERFKFLHWRTIYDAEQNAELRKKRPNPNLLVAGDQVFVPDKEPRNEEAPTGQRSVFRVFAGKTRLRVAFLGNATNDWTLTIGGKTFQGQVAPGGMIEQEIPASATSGTLVLTPTNAPDQKDTWSVSLGALAPIEELSGVQARLDNLAFSCPVDGKESPETKAAIKAYQVWRKLAVQDGTLDDATRADLAQVHDG